MVLLIHHRQQAVHRQQRVIDEQEDGPLWANLYPVSDDCDEVSNREIGGDHEALGA